MTFGQSIQTCLSKYATFAGRASRSEFWFFGLFGVVLLIPATILDNMLGTTFSIEGVSLGYGYLYLLVGLGLFLPNLSVFVRRLHDKDKSGWWYWLMLVPIVGAIVVLVWLCQRGTIGENRFGADPLGD